MNLTTFDDIRVNQKVDFQCDECEATFTRTKKLALVGRRQWQKDLCRSCAARNASIGRAQNTSAFWDQDRKRVHGETMKQSDAYYDAIRHRDQTGERNGMYGKTHTPETKTKMSRSRTGKLGENATAWKGGHQSVAKRVKRALQRRHQWFTRVLARANHQCELCGEKALDAHHLEPIITIIRRVCEIVAFENDDAKVEWLMSLPEIVDHDLKNGQALCRGCHQKAHTNWGSRVAP
jgi:hypothetical protein